MVDILVGFAKGGQGSADFYDSMQYVIFKGHMFNRNIFHQVDNNILLVESNRDII